MSDLERRVRRLEWTNRVLLVALGGVGLLAWQAGPETSDLLRTRRLEVVDEKGTPLVIVGPDRTIDGGTVTLRDRAGERRAWFRVEANQASLAMRSDASERPATVGFGVSKQRASLSLLSSSATTTVEVAEGKPKVEMIDDKGKSVFRAPYR